jgi:ribosomal protein S18 acetylase RimI-like enzyme
MMGSMTSDVGAIVYRPATAQDADAIAGLHADSWRRNYRGAYADAYLDGDVLGDRRVVWAARLATDAADRRTIVAESDRHIAGFAHVVLDSHPIWGALLDNLHVAHDRKRQGIGAQLMVRVARTVVQARPASGLFLWVLEQNRSAQAFYESVGGRCVEREVMESPEGDPSRLTGRPVCLRYFWSDPAPLIRPRAGRRLRRSLGGTSR